LSMSSSSDPNDCCSKCQTDSSCGAFTHSQYDASGQPNPTCYLKSSCGSGSSSNHCTSGTVGNSPSPSPSPSPPPSGGLVEYCPDPANDFQLEVEPGATGSVTWTDSGWRTQGQRRVSSKASFDFSGGGAWFDMDLSGAHNGVNTNVYVTYPYSENCGISCYCDSGGNHDAQGRGCAEMDWTENNGNCYAATTWHDDQGGGDGGGYGDHTNLNSALNTFSAEYSGDGSQVTITVNGHAMGGNGHQSDMKSRGAVIYSSQWVGWVPGEWCGGDGNLQASVYEMKNLRVTAKVVQGPEPRRCNPVTTAAPPVPVPSPVPTPTPSPAPSSCPGGSLAACVGMCPSEASAFQACVSTCQERCGDGSSCSGADDGSSLKECVSACPAEGYGACVSCCGDKFPESIV